MICYFYYFSTFFNIAIPAPVIDVTATGTGVAGESYFVVCSVDVDDNLYNIVVDTSVVKIGEGVVTSSVSSGDNNVTISYTPLMTSHNGQYQCVVNISQIDISYQNSNVKTFTINTTSKLQYILIFLCMIIILTSVMY